MAKKPRSFKEAVQQVGRSKARTNKWPESEWDSLPDIGVEYDLIHLQGTDEDIIHEEPDCFAVDWRGSDVILEEINTRLDRSKLRVEKPARGFSWTISYRGKRASGREPDVWSVVLAANRTLQGHYEIRVSRESLYGDTFEFMIKPVKWWRAMDKNFARRTDDV